MPAPKSKVPQLEFARHLLWVDSHKGEIQAEVDGGKSIAAFAVQLKIPASTMKAVFKGAGIQCGRAHTRSLRTPAPAEAPPHAITAIVTVLARLCKGLGEPYEELKPFLPEQ